MERVGWGGVVAEAGASNPPIYVSIWKHHRSGLSPERTPAAQDTYGMLCVIFYRHERERNQLRGKKKNRSQRRKERKNERKKLEVSHVFSSPGQERRYGSWKYTGSLPPSVSLMTSLLKCRACGGI